MNLEEFKIETENGITVCKFGATWCQPCKTMDKTLDVVAKKYPEIKVLHLDVEENTELATEFQVTSIPATFVLVNGELKERLVGAVPEKKISSVLDEFVTKSE